MRPILLTLTLLFFVAATSAQFQPFRWAKDRIGRLIHDTLPPEQPRFLAYPTLAFSPETSWEIGLSALYLYYAKRDTLNRLSEINTFTFFTLENQYGIWLDHALYSNHDRWFFLGRLRWQSFPLLYYGIGPETEEDYLARVEANYLLLRERVLRRIFGSVYFGVEMDYQGLTRTGFEWEDEPGELPLGAEGTSNLGLGFGLLHDDRHNVLNVRRGWFAELALLRYDRRWGSDLDFTNLIVDTRLFQPVGRRRSQVLAAQLFGQFTGGDVPFNQLALLGGESLMRGYYLGRYRDRNLLAGQVEYRWLPFPFSRRFGGAVFLAAGGVAPRMADFRLSQFVPAGGLGLRFLIFPSKDIYTRLDVAFTREGPGYYLFVGEAF